MFNYFRKHALTSAAIVLVAAAGLLLILQRQHAVDDVVRVVEQQNVALARSFANVIWPRFSGYVASVSGMDGETLRGRGETREIHEILQGLISDVPVLRVKIFNADGLTIYSSDPAQIGEDESGDPHFVAAMRESIPSTKLVRRDAFQSFAGELNDRHIVESYLPIHVGDGPVEGVFEIYTDVTPLLASAGETATLFVILLAVVFGLSIVGYVRGSLSAQRLRDTADAAAALTARLGRIVEDSFSEVYVIDAHTLRFAHVNRGGRENLGYTMEELARLTPADIVRNFSRERFDEFVKPLWTGQSHQVIAEPTHIRKDGSNYYANARIQLFENEDPPVFAITARDITEQKQARVELKRAYAELESRVEERTAELAAANEKLSLRIAEHDVAEQALRASEARLQAIMDNTSALVHLKDAEGRYMLVNRQIQKIVGAPASDIIGKTDHDLTSKEMADARAAHDLRVIETRAPMQIEESVIQRDGGTRTYLSVKFPLLDDSGEAYAVGGISTDITDRKRAEKALRAAKENLEAASDEKDAAMAELHAVLDRIDYGVVFMDADLRGRIINKAFQEIWGIPPEFIAKNPTARELMEYNRHNGVYAVAEDEWDAWAEQRVASIERGDIAPMEFERADGVTLQYQCTALPNGGRMLTYFDITRLKRNEAALQTARDELEDRVAERTEELRAIMDNSVIAVVTTDSLGAVMAFNPAAEKLFGFQAKDVISRNVDMLMPDLHRAAHDGYIADYLESGQARVIGKVRQLVGRRGDGGEFPMELSVAKMSLRGETCFVANVTDLTERVAQEERLRHAYKMESLGQLTGGVAHEFNNLLTAIGGFAHMAARAADDTERVRECLGEIVKASDQAAGLTRQMLAFARKQELEAKVVSTNRILVDLQTMVKPIVGDAIPMRMSLSDEELWVSVDPDQLSQAILNLAINACHAMPDGGQLTIGSRTVELDESRVALYPHADAGRYVAVFVSDTGTGIDAETLEHIFDPFFTTKETDQGTGLGLSMVYGMVEQSGGIVDVDSEVGAGTTFTIYLPRVEGARREDGEDIGPAVAARKATILVAEDKKPIRDLVRTTLEGLGYTVLTAEDGAAAAEIYRENADDIDLLLVDAAMPGEGGLALARELASQKPNLKIVFLSGHGDARDLKADPIGRESVLLPKPFDPDDLGQLVGEVIAT